MCTNSADVVKNFAVVKNVSVNGSHCIYTYIQCFYDVTVSVELMCCHLHWYMGLCR